MKKHFHINGYALSLALNKIANENRTDKKRVVLYSRPLKNVKLGNFTS